MKAQQTLCCLALFVVGIVANAEAGTREVYDHVVSSTFWIVDLETGVTGSGFVFNESRRLGATAGHVAPEGEVLCFFIVHDSETGEPILDRNVYLNRENWSRLFEVGCLTVGRVISSSPDTDLAILQLGQLPSSVHEIEFASFAPEADDYLHIVGHPAERDLWSYTVGRVFDVRYRNVTYESGHEVSAETVAFYSDVFSGNSGGPVCNDEGQLVGVVSGGGRINSIAIYVSELQKLIDDLRNYAVVTISNDTLDPVHFSFRWSADDEWSNRTVQPGESWYFSYRQPWDETPQPEIAFDWSFQSGHQRESYSLDYWLIIAGQTPSSDQGRPYVFSYYGDNGIDLYDNLED